MFNSNCAALILMGGQNKRMHGQHKAFLMFNHQTFLERITTNLSSFSHLYLSVNDYGLFKGLDFPLIQDLYPSLGPMGGIYSALKTLPYDYLFVTGCDMPYITDGFAQFMIANYASTAPCFALSNDEGFFYPLGAIYNKSALPYIENLIEKKCYRMQQLINQSPSQTMALSDTPFNPSIFTNINTPELYHLLLKNS